VLAFERVRRVAHRGFIKRIRIVMHKAPVERRTHLVAKHSVLVRLAPRVKTRMKVERAFHNVVDANRLRQKAIHRAPEILDRNRILETHRRNLRQRMHTCIRPPRARNLYRPAFDRANYLFENALNCRQARLHLPAMEIRAVIGDLKPQSPHNAQNGDWRAFRVVLGM
jgi:hypothetical protein